jgi:nucleoid-associated protein YgaU
MKCLIFLLSLSWLVGCGQRHAVEEADAAAKAGCFERAIDLYEEALGGGGDRAAIHLKMARLYETQLADPAAASYHRRRAARIAGKPEQKGSPARESAAPSENAVTGSAVKPNIARAVATAEKEGRQKAHTYVVQPGDTLVSISRKFYQTPARWRDILDANQNQVTNPDELRAGQTIIVP